MGTTDKTEKINRRSILSTLWIVVMFNMAYADILSLYTPGVHEELAAFAGGTPITQLMLVGAIMIQVPILMVFLSKVLKYKINRWANIIAGVITIVYVIGGGSLTPHYIFIATIEVVCTLLIVWTAWKWPHLETTSSIETVK